MSTPKVLAIVATIFLGVALVLVLVHGGDARMVELLLLAGLTFLAGAHAT
jgi:hypothetical protein